MTTLAYLLILLGLIGSVLPFLPGPPLIWLGILLFASADNFATVGWPTLTILGILAFLAWGSELFLTPILSRRSGASWRSIFAAIVGGLIGGLFLSALPVLGTLTGSVVGAAVGMWLVEYYVRQDSTAATRAVIIYASGMALSAILEVILAVGMVLIFAWQLFV